MKTLNYSREALAAIRSKPSPHSVDADATYVLRFGFDEPLAPRIDRATVRLEAGRSASTLEVPIVDYAQKTKLLFPLVTCGRADVPRDDQEVSLEARQMREARP